MSAGRSSVVRLSSCRWIEVQSPVGALGEGLLEGLAGGEPEDEWCLAGEPALEVSG
jgi:hypothetical protein